PRALRPARSPGPVRHFHASPWRLFHAALSLWLKYPRGSGGRQPPVRPHRPTSAVGAGTFPNPLPLDAEPEGLQGPDIYAERAEMAQESPERLVFPRAPARRRLAPANWAIVGIFIILAFDMIARAREFLMPVALGVLLFFVFAPFRRWMERRGIKPGVTAGIVVLGILATVGMIGFSVSGPAGQLIDDAPQISRQLKQKYEDFREN